MYEIVYTGIMNYVIMNSPSAAELQQQQRYAAEIAMYAKQHIDSIDVFTEIHDMCSSEDNNEVIMKKIHELTKNAIENAIAFSSI